jgi:hypothetical protein
MKRSLTWPVKRFVALMLIFLLLFSVTTAYGAAPGSPSDPLISLNYVNSTFLSTVQNDRNALINSSLSAYYGDAGAKLRAVYDSTMARLGGMPGYTFAPSFTSVDLPIGATAGLVTGSTFVLVSGAVSVNAQSGTVINISTGQEIAAGISLTTGQRYFCAEETMAIFTAANAAVALIDGYYTTTGTPTVSLPFLDVRSADWFYGAVSYVTGRNLFTGTSAATFAPLGSMTRGMFVTVLHRLAGKPQVSANSVFTDVSDASKYYYAAVVWANANNIVTGYSDGKFHPDDAITREQMAVIISRYAALAGYSVTPGGADVYNTFSDKGSVSSYAVDAMVWATSAGLINGSGGKLTPKGTASRAQVAQIILNFCQRIIGV